MRTLRRTAPLLPLLALVLPVGFGCGAQHLTYAHFPPAVAVSLTTPEASSEVEAFAGRFYAETADPGAAEAELATLLEAHPGHATLHEIAAHLAELRGDTGAAATHWLRAAADQSSPLTAIYLDLALRENLTASQESAAITLLEALHTQHPSRAVRADAARRLVSFYEAREQLGRADALAAGLGFVSQWHVIGAFDNDQGRGFYTEHPPETDASLDAEHRGLLLPVRWRELTTMDRAGVARIDAMVAPHRWAVAYLATNVTSPSERDVSLRLTTPTGTRVWLNGRLVVDQERLTHGATDNIVVDVHLREGANRLLVKSAQDDFGSWYFGARFTDAEGRALTDLRSSAPSGEVPDAIAAEPPVNLSPLADALEAVEPPLRRELLTLADANRNGFAGDALAVARTLLERAPQHPVVLYQAALTHWYNEELGRAMDLLNEGASRYSTSAGFLVRRGAFYRERDRYDRALEDLGRARELEPGARLAAMEMAGTFADRGWREHECRVLEEVTERWPDSSWAVRAWGNCLEQRSYLDRATEQYRRAEALEPGHSWNLGRLATMARWRGDHDTALAYAARLRALAPWSGDSRLTQADFFRFAGRRDEALALYREAAAQNPAWARPHARLGAMAYEGGDSVGALTAWSSALARDPDNSALADRVDHLRDDESDPDRQLMPSAEQIEAALARATEMEVDPGAHTALVLDDEVTTVQQDGSSMRRITQVHLAVTTDGRDALIATQVPAHARVLEAYAVSGEGRRQEASSIRGGTIRFRGLDVGSRVVVQYVFHDQPPAFLPNQFVSSWLFQGVGRQLDAARWVVMVPAGRELAMHIQGPVEHEMSNEGEHDRHVFTASNVPALVAEPRMPPARDLLAMVVLSTLTDWQAYVDWERAMLSEVFESNAQLRALATQLTEGASTPQERLDRIYRYVSQEIRYQQDYEDTIAGVRPHSCPVVLERGYGDCKDKAVLMILLGREVGLDLRFVVLRTLNAGRVLQEVPNQQFNHAIVYVPAQEGIEGGFMDPTTDGLDMGNLRADDQGATALVLDPSDGAWEFRDIPYQSADINYMRCGVDVDVTGPEAASANVSCQVRGSTGSALRRAMRNEERAAQVRQNIANSIFTGASVTEGSEAHLDDIDHPLEMTMRLDASPALQAQGEERRIRVPHMFGLGNVTRLAARRTPLRLGVPDSSRFEVNFEVPAGARVTRTPDDFAIEHACFRINRRSVTRGRRVSVTIDYQRTCAEVSPEDYPELRRLAQQATNPLQADIVFRMGS